MKVTLCPRCRMPLFEGFTHGIMMLGCGQCGGVWLDNEASQEVVRRIDRDVTELAERVASHAKVVADARPDKLPCPSCSRPMTRLRVPGTTIDLDVCAPHGTWFDAHELKVVALAYAPLPAPMRPNSEAELAAYRAQQHPSASPSDAQSRLALVGLGLVVATIGAAQR